MSYEVVWEDAYFYIGNIYMHDFFCIISAIDRKRL